MFVGQTKHVTAEVGGCGRTWERLDFPSALRCSSLLACVHNRDVYISHGEMSLQTVATPISVARLT